MRAGTDVRSERGPALCTRGIARMSFIEVGGQRRPIPPGESVIGSDASAFVRVTGPAVEPRHAVLRTMPDGQVAISRASETAEILVNGVRLGPQPTPLLHGDKVVVSGHELLFVEERRSGSTQYVQAINPAMFAGTKPKGTHAPTAATGGRLVSLTDGREYTVTGASLVIGRDAGCDVVVTNKDVSRRHAEIMATPKGYLLVDGSTNGTFVNGRRVTGQQVLARADVIRVGDHEFRFYADVAPAPVPEPPVPPSGASHRLANTMHSTPVYRAPRAAPARPAAPRTPAPPAPPVSPAPPAAPAPRASAAPGALAYLVIRSGALKGQRLPIRVPVVNIGRADYNDIPLPDESVSTTHAKIQRREGIWMVVDLDSTNGTYVDGERVTGDASLAPGALLRFGEVRAFFEPADQNDAAPQGGSTKLLQAIKLPTDQ